MHDDKIRTSKVDPAWLTSIGRKQKDRHSDQTHVISIRVTTAVYYELYELIQRSPRTHDSIAGFIAWLIETQALRRR